MGLRPAKTIRDPDKVAWTRYSRSKPRRSYIKAMPHKDLHQFRMGTDRPDYDLVMHLRAEEAVILRDNAIESARLTANKHLENNMAGNYFLVVRVYPHHVIRENKMIAGAGADRLQKGMRKSFGRPSDLAARLTKGTMLFSVRTYKANTPHVLTALGRAKRKISGKFSIITE